MSSVRRTALAAFAAYSTHYAVTKLYSTFCVPSGFFEFFHGVLITGSPICAATFSIMSNTHITYSTIMLTSLTRILIDKLADISFYREEKIEHKEPTPSDE